jgi:hypothetical protein
VKLGNGRFSVGLIRLFHLVLAALVIFLHKTEPNASLIFPPLGTVDVYVLPTTLVFIALSSIFAWNIRSIKKAMVALWVSACLFVGSIIFLAALTQLYVVSVDVPVQNRTIHRTVGSERTEFAKKWFDDKTDSEMLKEHGLSESDISELWTRSSLLMTRLAIFIACLFAFSSLNFGIGAFARAQELRANASARRLASTGK